MNKLLYILLVVLLLVSCEKSITKSPDDNLKLKVGALTFNIDITAAVSDIISMRGHLSKSNEDTIKFTFVVYQDSAFALVQDIPIGLWCLHVDAYDENENIIYFGTANIEVKPGIIVPVELYMTPKNGGLSIIVTWDDLPPGYPAILFPLSESELNELQQELNLLLNDEYKANLDKYGLISWTGGLSRGKSSISDVNEAIKIAKSVAVEFGKFTNVMDTSLLVVDEKTYHRTTDLLTDWAVIFQNQTYEDIEVLNTYILVLITDDIIQILGHHYKDIFIPDENWKNIYTIEKLLIGMEIVYQFDYSEKDTFIVTEQDLHVEGATEEASIKILPYERNGRFEMRVCWRVPIFFYGGIYPLWYVFVDVYSGEIITCKEL